MSNFPQWARGQFQVNYEDRIDFPRLRAEILGKVQAAMADEGLDALFFWRDENVRYLTSLRVLSVQYRSSTTYGVLLPQQGRPVVFITSGELARAEESMPWIEEFYPIPILDEPGLVERVMVDKIVPAFKKYGLTGARVAIDAYTKIQDDAYRRLLPSVEFVDGHWWLQQLRWIKTNDELKIIEEATAIADAMTQTAMENVRAGARECEVAGEAMRTMFRLGAEFSMVASPFVASGERMAPPTRFATDKIIRHGDLVFIDIGAYWNGYFSDIGRTVICGGRASDQQKRIYSTVYECLMAGIEKMTPGTTCGEVADAIKRVAARYGLEDNFINLFIGHGVGAAPTEPPFIGETMPGADDPVLKPGMVLALEPLIFVPGVRGGGGVRIEDMILVTEDRPHIISRCPYDERLLV